MKLSREASKAEIYNAIGKLKPNNPDSFLIVEIGSDRIDSVQAYMNPDKTYHVEILRKGGNMTEFNGNRIMVREKVSLADTITIFKGIAEAGDTSTIYKQYAGFKDNTTRYLTERKDAHDFRRQHGNNH